MIIKTSPDEIENFLVDASNVKGFCDAVYFPENAEDVEVILREANKKKTPVTVSGNGTGLAGGRVPFGGIVISTEKLNKIIEINREEMFAVLEPGVLLSEFLEITKSKGLLYPPDPTEKNCFIGATVATNASGEKTFKYGATRNYVLELEVILANGEMVYLKRGERSAVKDFLNLKDKNRNEYHLNIPSLEMPQVKNASGYYIKEGMDAIDLFIGSEGTLGVITKIKLKLLPYPSNILSCIIFFNDEKNALRFIDKAREISFNNRELKDGILDALALEFFDKNALQFLSKDYQQIPQNAEAAVWFEQEVIDTSEDEIIEKWMELISEFDGDEETAWFAFTDGDKKKIQEFRHAVSWKISEYLIQNNVRKLGTDVAVPHQNFQELYFFSKHQAEDAEIHYVVYGHFGNSHMHLNMLPKNDEEYQKGKDVYKNICCKAVELKGTVSAEHGIGKLKPEYLLMMYGEDGVSKMSELKKALDPNWILGRGNIFGD